MFPNPLPFFWQATTILEDLFLINFNCVCVLEREEERACTRAHGGWGVKPPLTSSYSLYDRFWELSLSPVDEQYMLSTAIQSRNSYFKQWL